MKVAIIGAHSVGKSTLLEALKKEKEFEEVEVFLQEVAREWIEDYGQDQCFNSFSWQTSLIDEQATREEKATSFISDRSVLDAEAYALHHYRKSCFDSKEKLLTFISHRYTKVVFLLADKNKEVEDDGIRNTDKQYQLEIENKLLELVNICKDSLPVILYVEPCSKEETLLQVKNFLL